MDSLWNGDEIRETDCAGLMYSAPSIVADRDRHWTGTWWRVDSQSSRWQADWRRQPLQEKPQQQRQSTYQVQGRQQNPQATQPGNHQQTAATPQWLNEEKASSDAAKWDRWLADQQVIAESMPPRQGLNKQEDHLSIVVASRVHMTKSNKVQDGPTSLRYMTIPESRLLSIARGLKIHRAFFALVEDGNPAAVRVKTSIERRKCEVFLLRTSNAISSQSAIAITHFPKTTTHDGEPIGCRTNALVLGYDEGDLVKLKSALDRSDEFPCTPSRLIMSFLEIESEKRFTEVRKSVREMQDTIHTLAEATETGAPSSRRKLNETVSLYFQVYDNKNDGLSSWRDQLLLFKSCLSSDPDSMLVEYLQQLVARYNHRIGRCDMVLQGATLAYQMETTHLSRKDTEIAVGDGKTMKAIAFLTMIFLPGTFIATMLAVPQIEAAMEAKNDGSFGDEKWKWYIALTLPLTSFVLLAYAVWEWCYKPRYLKNLFGDKGKPEEN